MTWSHRFEMMEKEIPILLLREKEFLHNGVYVNHDHHGYLLENNQFENEQNDKVMNLIKIELLKQLFNLSI